MSPRGELARCKFEGAITQFASTDDLEKAVEYIIEGHRHANLDPRAELVRADVTLENYIRYVFPKYCVLIMMPVTENGIVVQHKLESLLGPSI